MKRRRYIGQANKVGIEFTDLSTSNLNAQQAGMVYGNTPTGSLKPNVSYATGTDYSNIDLYKITDDTAVLMTDNDTETTYHIYIVVTVNGTQYIMKMVNNQIEYEIKTDFDNYSSNSSYQWQLEGGASSFKVHNQSDTNMCLYVNAQNELDITVESSCSYFSRTGSKFNQTISSSVLWTTYMENGSLRTIKNDDYQTFLYTYTYYYSSRRYYYTLTKKTADTISNGDDVFIVARNSNGSYYLIGRSDNNLNASRIAPTSDNGTTIEFNTKSGLVAMMAFSFVVEKNNNNLYLQGYDSLYYLNPPTKVSNNSSFSLSNQSVPLTYTNSNGLCVYANGTVPLPFGVKSIGNSFTTDTYQKNDDNTMSGGTTIVFRYDGSAWSPYYGSLNAGETYAIAVRQAPTDPDNPGAVTADYYLVGYDGTKMTHHNFSTFADIVITSDCEFVATQGTYGVGLTSNSKGLNVNNEYLAMLDVSAEWVYIGDSVTPENSRLWSVTTQTVTYYPEYANSDLEANTSATDTKAECYLVQNGKIQTLVDELVSGETYVIVFVDYGNHYAACVNGTDIVPVLYANSLPKNLPSDYHFVAEASGQGFLLTHNNQAMGVAVNTKLTIGYNAIWTYKYVAPEESE